VVELQMSVDEALKYVISMGVVVPPPPAVAPAAGGPKLTGLALLGNAPVLRACDTARLSEPPLSCRCTRAPAPTRVSSGVIP
jgi:hypothetical protein